MGGAGASAYELSPSIVEAVEVLRDDLWILSHCVHPDLRHGMWRAVARYGREREERGGRGGGLM